MVVVPSDDDYKARCKAQEEAGHKDIPDEALMEMKGSSRLVRCGAYNPTSRFSIHLLYLPQVKYSDIVIFFTILFSKILCLFLH